MRSRQRMPYENIFLTSTSTIRRLFRGHFGRRPCTAMSWPSQTKAGALLDGRKCQPVQPGGPIQG